MNSHHETFSVFTFLVQYLFGRKVSSTKSTRSRAKVSLPIDFYSRGVTKNSETVFFINIIMRDIDSFPSAWDLQRDAGCNQEQRWESKACPLSI